MLLRLRASFAALALLGSATLAHAQPLFIETCADNDAVCAAIGAPLQTDVDVAGVRTSPDDARQLDEEEPFIINSGFGG